MNSYFPYSLNRLGLFEIVSFLFVSMVFSILAKPAFNEISILSPLVKSLIKLETVLDVNVEH
jgi:hypothetical protein